MTDQSSAADATADPTPPAPADSNQGLDPVTGIQRDLLIDIDLPRPRTVSRIQGKRIAIPAGGRTGVHEHNGPVVGVVLEGTAIMQIVGQEPVTINAGEPFYEPEAVRMLRFDAGPDGLVFLGFFPVGPGEDPVLTPLD
ncbi:hypothetical protein GCM10027515_07750 [Schumannella luteola]|uniref:Quercetin dioxygenase-like cupin family protein n=1 Tax=Schumannella luteola TaxID=472059 RepID=A0A852YLK7_9MICO|nr:hypothetical protein [Schumannella luteola]NYG98095.1 quercetin dioxygenase-like cupin family protein [Schumannella luteola]TPX01818.1 hypothetical protein FJ656_25870 [Schumannella luteola]